MALIIPPLRGATYLRVDGLRVDLNPESVAHPPAKPGEEQKPPVFTVPSARRCEVHLYAYADAAARSAKAAPVWDAPLQFTLADLALPMTVVSGSETPAGEPCYTVDAVTPDQLWAAIYALIARLYPRATTDDQPRGVEAGLVSG